MENLVEKDEDFIMETLDHLIVQSFTLYWRVKVADLTTSRTIERILNRKFDSLYNKLLLERGLTSGSEEQTMLQRMIADFSTSFAEERRAACDRHLVLIRNELLKSDLEYLVRVYDCDTEFRLLLLRVETQEEKELAVAMRDERRIHLVQDYQETKNGEQEQILIRELEVNEQAISLVEAYTEDDLGARIGIV